MQPTFSNSSLYASLPYETRVLFEIRWNVGRDVLGEQLFLRLVELTHSTSAKLLDATRQTIR